jgi:integrase
MASVRKAKQANGKVFYQAVWSVAGMDGKRKQQTKAFDKLADARSYANRMAEEVENRLVADPQRHTVAQYLSRWLATLRHRAELSPATIVGYERCIGLLVPHVGHIQLSKLTPLHLDEAYSNLLHSGGKSRTLDEKGQRQPRPLAARTVHHVHRCVHTAFEAARRWKMIGENPARDARPPSPNRSKAKAMNQDEATRVWHAALKSQQSERGYPGIDCAVMLLMVTGIRRGELAGLCWDCVHLDEGRIEIRRTVVTDGGRQPILRETAKTEESIRSITIPPAMVDRLREHWAFTAGQMMQWGRDYQRALLFVFPEAGGTMMHPDTLYTRLRSIMRSAGIKGIQPTHGYRHTMATALLASGTDIKTISSRLGHSLVSTTANIYIHSEDERDRAAADLLGERLARLTK